MTRRRKAGRCWRTPPLGLAGGIDDVATPRPAGPEPSGAAGSPPTAKPRPGRAAHPVLDLLGQLAAVGVFTLFVVSVLVFLATEVLPEWPWSMSITVTWLASQPSAIALPRRSYWRSAEAGGGVAGPVEGL